LATIEHVSEHPVPAARRFPPVTTPKRAVKAPRKASATDALSHIAPPQLDLFPVKPVVDVLDAKAIVGPRTGVEHLVRVRPRPNDAPHLVFHDRHGWYCEAHGPSCHAVMLAREEVKHVD
jgi:hypothetical protein